MMTTFDVRRTQLRKLVRDRFDGRQVRLAEATKRSDTYINRLLMDPSNEHHRNLGEKLAREFEVILRLPAGWLDSIQNDDPYPAWKPSSPSSTPTPKLAPTTAMSWKSHDDLPHSEYSLIPRKMVMLSAGSGKMSFQEEEGPPLAFRSSWLIDQGLIEEKLVVAYVTGDSMCPCLCDGDTILIDTAHTSLIDGKVYAIRQGDELRVKRIYKHTLTVTLHSDNQLFPDEDIPTHLANELHIIGRVVWSAGSL